MSRIGVFVICFVFQAVAVAWMALPLLIALRLLVVPEIPLWCFVVVVAGMIVATGVMSTIADAKRVGTDGTDGH